MQETEEGKISASEQSPGQGAGKLDIETVRAKMQIPPEMEKPYQKMVLAGMKIMFSPETRSLIVKELAGDPAAMGDKLGVGMVRIMTYIWKESNNTLPPQLIIPVALELLMHAADFVKRAGIAEISDEEIGDAMEKTIFGLMSAFGVDPQQAEQAMVQLTQGSGQQAQGLIAQGAQK